LADQPETIEVVTMGKDIRIGVLRPGMIKSLLPLMPSLQLSATVNPFKFVIGFKTLSIKLDVFGPAAMEGSPLLDFLKPVGPDYKERVMEKEAKKVVADALNAKLLKAEAKAQLERVLREEAREQEEEHERLREAGRFEELPPDSIMSPTKMKDRSKKVKKESESDDEIMADIPSEFDNSREDDEPALPLKSIAKKVVVVKNEVESDDEKPLIQRIVPAVKEEDSDDEPILKRVELKARLQALNNEYAEDDGEYEKVEGEFTFDVAFSRSLISHYSLLMRMFNRLDSWTNLL
jgi:hypothetical protein